MFLVFYLISVFYCIWRMVRSYVKRNGGDVAYTTPGLETLAIIVMAPVLMVVDVTLTWIRVYSEAEKARRNNSGL
jgi:trehalose utilization protein